MRSELEQDGGVLYEKTLEHMEGDLNIFQMFLFYVLLSTTK